VLVIAGLAVVALPLRLFPIAGRFISLGWAVACALASTLDEPHGAVFRSVVTVLAVALALGWALRLASSAAVRNKMADSSGGVPGAALVAACLGVAIAATLLWLAAGSAALATPLAWAIWVALASALLASTGFAAVAGTAGWLDRSEWFIDPPRQPRRFAGRSGGRPQSAVRSRQALDRFIDNLSRVIVHLILSIVDMLIYILYYRISRIVIAVANWLLLWLIMLFITILRSLALLLHGAWSATRIIAIPTFSLLIAAALILSFARADVDYVKTGSLDDLGVLVGFLAAAYGLLTLAWTALSAMKLKNLSAAIVDMTGPALAIVIVMVLIGGWSFAILGAFGNGPFHVGWLTLTSTASVLVVIAIRGLRRRSTPSESGLSDLAPRMGQHDNRVGTAAANQSFTARSTPVDPAARPRD
jgi:hypothetical protein